jgi:hypothetical protein
VWAETSVGRALLKSVPAKLTRLNGRYRNVEAAWGAPIAGVEVRIDEGPWAPATLGRTPGEDAPFAWRWRALDWGTPAPRVHTITSRATDARGNVQPAPDSPWLTGKRTYWESNGQVTRRVRIS